MLALLTALPGIAWVAPADAALTVAVSNRPPSTLGSKQSGAAALKSWKWSTPKQVSTAGPTQFVVLSCGTPTSCLAADEAGFYYRWDGRRWSLASRYGFPTDGVFESYRVGSLSCTTGRFCASVEVYSNDVSPPTGSVVFWNGDRPSRQTIPDGWGAAEVSCTSPTDCVAVPDDLSPGWARWDGTSWQVQDPSFVDARGLTCASATLCLARGTFDSKVLRFTGTAWVVEPSFPPSTVSCVSTALCLATGTDGVTRRFTGSAWVVAPIPPVGGSLSCASSTYCVDFGATSFSVYNGRRWTPPRTLPSAPVNGLLSCVRGAAFCAAAEGNQLAQFTWRRWSRVTTAGDAPAPLNRVSCATPRSCVGVDTYDAHEFTPGGQTARTRLGLAMEPPSTLTDVSCVSTTFCVATTSQRMPSDGLHVFDGTEWQSVSPEGGISTSLRSVSCASPRFCVAVGEDSETGNGLTALFDGASWRSVASPGLAQVSCVSATFCLGTTGRSDGSSESRVFDGTSWSGPRAFGDTTALSPVSVSCASTQMCVAVDGRGRAATYRNARWSAFNAVTGAGPLVAVSCHRPGTCQAVSSTAKVVRYQNSSWSRPRSLKGLTSPTSISCPSSTACVVVDDSGQAVFGRS